MEKALQKTCVIYCRVSSKEQVDGTSLESQERFCREYAERHNIQILKVFIERGESAKTVNRTEFNKAITYCTEKKGRVDYFIVYKLDRFARNQEDHVTVRALLRKRASTELRSVTEPIDESAVGKLMESVIAGVAEFDNTIRSDRCKNGMMQRVKEGFWVWPAPLGYYRPSQGSNLVPEPERSHLIHLAFNEYAKGVYTYRSLAEFLAERGLRTKAGKLPSMQLLEKVLSNPIYCGRIAAFGEVVIGKFEPIVTEELFESCQRVRRGETVSPRSINNPLFSLRRFVACSGCGAKLTGSQSRGRHGARHAYYHHGAHKCSISRSIPKESFEQLFVELLDSVTPDEKYEKLFKAIVLDAWQDRYKTFDEANARIRREIEMLQQDRQKVFDIHRNGKYSDQEFSDQKELINRRIEEKKLLLRDQDIREIEMEKALDYAFYFVRNASKVWLESSYEQKIALQKLIFTKPVPFDGEKFGTPDLSLVYQQKKTPLSESSSLVARRGIEPLFSP